MNSVDYEKYFKSEEFKRINDIELFKDSEYIFEKNFDQLLDVLDNYKEKAADFKRVLHNFLMSNSTLMDHSRILVKKCKSVQEIINKKIEINLKDCPQNNFVKDLRNYITHYALPINFLKLIEQEGNFVGLLSIDKKSLLKFTGWSKNAKEFLDKADDNISLKGLLISHYNNIATFYNWLDKTLRIEYENDFKIYTEFINFVEGGNRPISIIIKS